MGFRLITIGRSERGLFVRRPLLRVYVNKRCRKQSPLIRLLRLNLLRRRGPDDPLVPYGTTVNFNFDRMPFRFSVCDRLMPFSLSIESNPVRTEGQGPRSGGLTPPSLVRGGGRG